MNKHIVTYDLGGPNRNYDALHAAIKTATQWLHLNESAWVVWTELSADRILAELRVHLDRDDSLAVLPLSDSEDGSYLNLPPDVAKSLVEWW